MADQNNLSETVKVDPWAKKTEVQKESKKIPETTIIPAKIESSATPKVEESIKSENAAKPMESSSKRSASGVGGTEGKKKSSQALRDDPPPIMPGSFETLPVNNPLNKVEALKVEGKIFGGAEGQKQAEEKATKEASSTDQTHIIK